jgi:chorismate mutase
VERRYGGGHYATHLARAADKGKHRTCQRGLDPTKGVNRSKVSRMTDDQLKSYRESIDNIDAALVFLLAERFKVTQAVGRYKAKAGLPPADPGREAAQIERLRTLARSANLDPDFSEKFLRFIIDEVIRHHERVRGETK